MKSASGSGDGVTLVKTIHAVTDLRGIPDKRALNFGDCNFAGFYPGKKRFDEVLVDGIFLRWRVSFSGECYQGSQITDEGLKSMRPFTLLGLLFRPSRSIRK